jgi:GWxTD domain-containing protein
VTGKRSTNEFKNEYFVRIGEANRFFTEPAEPGWLQDRGRVDILLGPPTNRIT